MKSIWGTTTPRLSTGAGDHFNAGFSKQDFTASLVLQANDALRFKPATRVENACATGSAAIHQGVKAIEAKRARIVLAVGVEQMTPTPGPEVGANLLRASYLREESGIQGGFAGLFGQIATSYFEKYGDQSDALAMIAAKNHKNGVENPYAQMRKDLGFAFCMSRTICRCPAATFSNWKVVPWPGARRLIRQAFNWAICRLSRRMIASPWLN